jgi:hemerythrin superfamily protein
MALKDAISSVVDAALGHSNGKRVEASEGEVESGLGHDAIAILKDDHRKVEALFKEALGDKTSFLSSQRKTVALILKELALHAKVEEALFYPAVYGKTKANSEERQQTLEAVEEHGAMKDLMRKIGKAGPRDESFRSKVQVLSEIVEHHVEEEESSFFPEAKRLLGEERLEKLGAEIAKVKARSERRGAPKRAKKASARTKARARKARA